MLLFVQAYGAEIVAGPGEMLYPCPPLGELPQWRRHRIGDFALLLWRGLLELRFAPIYVVNLATLHLAIRSMRSGLFNRTTA